MKKDAKRKRNYTYYDLTQSMCRTCKRIIDAQIIFRDGKVYMRSICPEHGEFEALIASNVDWYLKAINSKQAEDKPRQFSKKILNGCPYDCGLCAWHEKACNIPIVSITNNFALSTVCDGISEKESPWATDVISSESVIIGLFRNSPVFLKDS